MCSWDCSPNSCSTSGRKGFLLFLFLGCQGHLGLLLSPPTHRYYHNCALGNILLAPVDSETRKSSSAPESLRREVIDANQWRQVLPVTRPRHLQFSTSHPWERVLQTQQLTSCLHTGPRRQHHVCKIRSDLGMHAAKTQPTSASLFEVDYQRPFSSSTPRTKGYYCFCCCYWYCFVAL